MLPHLGLSVMEFHLADCAVPELRLMLVPEPAVSPKAGVRPGVGGRAAATARASTTRSFSRPTTATPTAAGSEPLESVRGHHSARFVWFPHAQTELFAVRKCRGGHDVRRRFNAGPLPLPLRDTRSVTVAPGCT